MTTPLRRVEEWRYSSTILNLDTRWRWVVSFTTRAPTPEERAPGNHWIVPPGIELRLPSPSLCRPLIYSASTVTKNNMWWSSSTTSLPALGPASCIEDTEVPVSVHILFHHVFTGPGSRLVCRWYRGPCLRSLSGWSVKLTTDIHSALRLRMPTFNDAVNSVDYTTSNCKTVVNNELERPCKFVW
jgi:hypothetical protein